MRFKEKLQRIVKKNDSLLCVGLDVDEEKIPGFLFEKHEKPFLEFNKQIIENTKDLVCAYKLNMAFYEVLGVNGLETLEETINYIPKDVVVILDGKRNDIGNTARKYAKTVFDTYNADAATVNPLFGIDGVKPFLDYKNKCSFIICRTSNKSAADLQDLKISKKTLYQVIAEKIKEWSYNDNIGAVVGATFPEELKNVREILGDDIPLLIPGVGKQGGDIKKTVELGTNKNGEMAIINSSRGIIYAASDENFAEKSREVAESIKNMINQFRY